MELLTNSEKSVYQECPRKFRYMFEQRYRTKREAGPLVFGKLFHQALEMRANGFQESDIVAWIENQNTGENVFDIVKARELFRGYHRQYEADGLKFIAVEKEYSIPLYNPKTQAASRTFSLAGKIDAIVEDKGQIAVLEHKTCSDQIDNPVSNYWLKLAIDPQITGYLVGADSIGYAPTKIIYDVIAKPTIRPLKATSVEARKYKKDGTLYANQREIDETPEEYAERLRADIAEFPSGYFQRRDIARTELDLVEYLEDMWSIGKMIMESRNNDYWPRRPSQCFNFSTCPFYCVCAKTGTLEDTELFVRVENIHQELSEVTNAD